MVDGTLGDWKIFSVPQSISEAWYEDINPRLSRWQALTPTCRVPCFSSVCYDSCNLSDLPQDCHKGGSTTAVVRNSQGGDRASEAEAAWFSQMLMVLQRESDAVFQVEAVSLYRGNETAEQTVMESMTTLKELFLCLKTNEQQTFLLNSATQRLLYL